MSPRLEVHPFSLQHTVECGQFFRFTKDSGTYLVQSSGRIFSLWQKGKARFYEGVDESFLIRFFRLEEELHPILRAIDRDPVIHQAIQTYRGLRLIRQDPWECLISYLCSMAKAIPHIRSIIEGLCKLSGKRIRFGNYIGYEFPETLCRETSPLLESIGAGFRTAYLVNASQCIHRDQLIQLKSLPYSEAKKSLMRLSGVGRKVADW